MESSQTPQQPADENKLNSPQSASSSPLKTPSPTSYLKSPDIDDDLDKEIAEALGGMSLMDMIDEGQARKVKTSKTEPDSGIRKGRVISIQGDDIFVDLGGKNQGVLSREELGDEATIAVGDVIEICVLEYNASEGLLILSKKTAGQHLFRRNLREGALVEAKVISSNKGGLEMDIKGLRAFMPASQIDLIHIENLDSLIGEQFVCEVTQVERGDNNVVLSRRNILMREREEQKQKIWDELQIGQVRQGKVRSLMDYGAFVDIGGTDGLLHVKEISWSRIKHPSEVLAVGQALDVVVLDIDREKQRISLSLRQAGGDPWSTVEHKYPVGTRHSAQITNLMDFGAFAQLEPGVEGLIPISQMSWAGRIKHPSDVVQVGGMVEVEVLSIDIDKKRLSLSMKQLQQNPWLTVPERYFPNQICTGTVARLTDFGAFVTLEPGVDGLVHISEMSHKRVNSASDMVRAGQVVQVKVLAVDMETHRISLSIKQTVEQVFEEPSSPSAPVVEQAPVEEPKPVKKKPDKPRRGGLDFKY